MPLYAEKTTVPVEKSRAEIERLLAKHRCTAFSTGIDYDHGLARVQFRAHDRIVRFEILVPKRTDLSRAFAHVRERDQVERQKWRALLLVIKAKLESVENKIASFEEEFLAHIVLPNDRTVADYIGPSIALAYQTGSMKALPPPPDVEAKP